MANEPVTPPSTPTPAPEVQRNFRTFAKDMAALSGKPMPPSASKPVPAPPKPSTPAATPPPITPAAPKDEPKPLVVKSKPQEGVKPSAPPLRPQAAYEPPPAHIIPKAPTTSETREDVLVRLKRKAEAVQATEAIILPKAPTTSETREQVLTRLKAGAINVTKTPAPVAKPVAPPAPERIHTYKSDFAEHATSEDASQFSVIAAQADSSVSARRVRYQEKKPFPVAIVGGILLIVLGGSGLYAAYHLVTHTPMAIFAPRIPSLIVPDERRELPDEGREIMTELVVAANEPLEAGKVRITYTSLATTTSEGQATTLPQSGGALIAALAFPMPDILFRSIQPESTVGVIHIGLEQRAFFILRVDSFERSFAGMLEWEKSIQSDLGALYPKYPVDEGMASTTAAVTVNQTFFDEIVGNRDVRVLRDSANHSIMLYGFSDKETLILARDEGAYLALIERLAVSRGQ